MKSSLIAYGLSLRNAYKTKGELLTTWVDRAETTDWMDEHLMSAGFGS